MKKRRDDIRPIKNVMQVWPAFNKTDTELQHLQERLQQAIGEVAKVRHELARLCEAFERGYQKLKQRPHVSSILGQLWEQYHDLGTNDLAATKIAAALQVAITLADGKELSGEDIEDLANTLDR
jgi:DNA repair ATPase RecN